MPDVRQPHISSIKIRLMSRMPENVDVGVNYLMILGVSQGNTWVNGG